MPDLIEVQKNSYKRFLEEDLREVLADVSPITDYTDNLVLEFVDYSLDEPKNSVERCKERDMRLAKQEDMPEVHALFRDAIADMSARGIDQWDEQYPTPAHLQGDLAKGELYVGERDGHAKANLIDYFVRAPGTRMEALQRVLYCGVALTALIGTFVRVEKANGRVRVRAGWSAFSALGFLTLFVPFAIVVCAYETNDWSDYRTLAPFLWLVIAAYLLRGRRFVPACYLAGCAAILAVMLSGSPIGAFQDENRFVSAPFTADTQELCAAITYDASAADPFVNAVRTDLFTLETVSLLHPGLGMQTGWFTEDTVGKSGWILTDHLKIPLEGYELVLKNKAGSVYRRTGDM